MTTFAIAFLSLATRQNCFEVISEDIFDKHFSKGEVGNPYLGVVFDIQNVCVKIKCHFLIFQGNIFLQQNQSKK